MFWACPLKNNGTHDPFGCMGLPRKLICLIWLKSMSETCLVLEKNNCEIMESCCGHFQKTGGRPISGGIFPRNISNFLGLKVGIFVRHMDLQNITEKSKSEGVRWGLSVIWHGMPQHFLKTIFYMLGVTCLKWYKLTETSDSGKSLQYSYLFDHPTLSTWQIPFPV